MGKTWRNLGKFELQTENQYINPVVIDFITNWNIPIPFLSTEFYVSFIQPRNMRPRLFSLPIKPLNIMYYWHFEQLHAKTLIGLKDLGFQLVKCEEFSRNLTCTLQINKPKDL